MTKVKIKNVQIKVTDEELEAYKLAAHRELRSLQSWTRSQLNIAAKFIPKPENF